jgi:hypothetical protein
MEGDMTYCPQFGMTVANSRSPPLQVKLMLTANVIGWAAEGMIERAVCCLSTIVGLKGLRPELCQLEVHLSKAILTEVSVLLPRPS